MVFQEPLTSLNPALKVGDQLAEGLRLHTNMGGGEIRQACLDMLRRVQLNDPEEAMGRYPHEFSGGMRQRIMLASVMLLKPALLVADEPTTALDVMIQKEILGIMVGLVREEGASLLLVTHDLALVSEYADRVGVMEKGVLVECGPAQDVLFHPAHPYTRRLRDAVPGQSRKQAAKGGVPLIRGEDIRVSFADNALLWWRRKHVNAVKGVSVSISAGETVALVGESGSGKSTLGRALLGLTDMTSGTVYYDGREISADIRSRSPQDRKRMQLIFQDPFSSLNPRMTVGVVLRESLRHGTGLSGKEKDRLVRETLEKTGLSETYIKRLPHELSGGQRQRVCIARAMICAPTVVVSDEPVSALDVTVQAQVLNLLRDLQQEHNFAHLFISHDLAVVEEISDRVMVMYHGHILEEGSVAQIFDTPHHPYTVALLNAAPGFGATKRGRVKEVDWPAAYEPTPLDGIKNNNIGDNAIIFREVTPGHKVSSLRCRTKNDM